MSRNAVAIVSSLIFVTLAALLVLLPVPYVAWRPGQTVDVLSSQGGGQVIRVSGVETHETTGKLLMTTVSTTRVDASISLAEAVYAFVADDADAMPREVIYPPGMSSDQVRNEAVASMDKSRSNATVAALRAAGISVTEKPRIDSVVKSGPSADKLQPGDLVLAVDGVAVANQEEVGAQVDRHKAGEEIVFTVLREDKKEKVTVKTKATSTEGQGVVGITLDTGYQYAPQVTYGLDPNVTGPSAGLVFALGIYDRISDGELLGDRVVAGTGTIDANGQVGQIGAIREKIKGAERDGASVFLVPEANCGDIEGMDSSATLVKVATLKDAIAALQLINEANTSEVPTCG